MYCVKRYRASIRQSGHVCLCVCLRVCTCVRIECKKRRGIIFYTNAHLPSLVSSPLVTQTNLLRYFDIVYPSDGDREDLTTRELLSLIPAIQSGTREKLERMIEAGVGEA